MLRVLLAGREPAFLKSLTRSLHSYEDVDVVGWAFSGRDVISCAAQLTPDLVLLDVGLPGGRALEAAREIKGMRHPPTVVLLVPAGLPEYRVAARAAGLDGLIETSELPSALDDLLVRLRSG
jgi:DNA-binding NarL/FixJ family response regulator